MPEIELITEVPEVIPVIKEVLEVIQVFAEEVVEVPVEVIEAPGVPQVAAAGLGRSRGRRRRELSSQQPYWQLAPLPPGAEASVVRTWTVVQAAFEKAGVKAECPSGHRLTIVEACRKGCRCCANCGVTLKECLVSCSSTGFAACVRCALSVAK